MNTWKRVLSYLHCVLRKDGCLMYIINLTSHAISIVRDDNKSPLVIAPHGIVCRVKEETKTVSSINGIPIRVSHPTDVEGLPPQQEGAIYITSGMAASAAWDLGMTDVYCPSTLEEDIIRNEKGLTVAIKALKGKR